MLRSCTRMHLAVWGTKPTGQRAARRLDEERGERATARERAVNPDVAAEMLLQRSGSARVVAEDVDHPVTLVVATHRDVDNMTSLSKCSVVVSYQLAFRTALLE